MPDIFFADLPSTLLDPTGKPYPQCWTEQVEIPPDVEGDPVTYETVLKSVHQAYPWAPAIIGTLADGRNVYFELAADATEYKSLGVFLANSYYELASLYPDISKCCVEVTFVLNDEQHRCKLVGAPVGATIEAIYPPVQYLGVKAIVDPLIPSVSDIDLMLQDSKVKLKDFSIDFIKTHPACTAIELLTALSSTFGEIEAGLGRKLLSLYTQGAYAEGYTESPDFEVFRDWVMFVPKEILERI